MTTTVPPLPLSRNTAGILFLIAGIAVFAVQDLILKLLSGTYPLHQAMVLRSLTAVPFLLALVRLNGGMATLVTPGLRRMVGRGFVMFVAYTSYYLALAALPLATTVALYFAAPLFITLLSVLILKEDVGALRWLAVVTGFAGVIIMVRPGSALFDWGGPAGRDIRAHLRGFHGVRPPDGHDRNRRCAGILGQCGLFVLRIDPVSDFRLGAFCRVGTQKHRLHDARMDDADGF